MITYKLHNYARSLASYTSPCKPKLFLYLILLDTQLIARLFFSSLAKNLTFFIKKGLTPSPKRV